MDAIDTFLTKRKPLALKKGTHLVGILNLTPDSFSDGGDFVDLQTARKRLLAMVDAGAAIIDIGGESTRPGYEPVSVDEEIKRVVPLIELVREETEVLISVDTSKSAVAEAALVAGADIINDVWGAQGDDKMAEVIGRHRAACILMHNRLPDESGKGNIANLILEFWEASVARVQAAGVPKESIILDPGLGFGKTYAENWEVMRKLPALGQMAGYPLLLGASRKSMLAQLLKIKNPKERLHGTLATTAWAVQAGVDFIRVHDVQENRECAKVIEHCQNYAADTD